MTNNMKITLSNIFAKKSGNALRKRWFMSRAKMRLTFPMVLFIALFWGINVAEAARWRVSHFDAQLDQYVRVRIDDTEINQKAERWQGDVGRSTILFAVEILGQIPPSSPPLPKGGWVDFIEINSLPLDMASEKRSLSDKNLTFKRRIFLHEGMFPITFTINRNYRLVVQVAHGIDENNRRVPLKIYQRGLLFYGQEQYQDAIINLKATIKNFDSFNVRAYKKLLKAYVKDSEQKKKRLNLQEYLDFCIQQYLKSLSDKKEVNVCPIHFTGEAYSKLGGDYQKAALAKYRHTIEIDPYFAPAYLRLAQYYWEKESDRASAITYCELADKYNIEDGFYIDAEIRELYEKLSRNLRGELRKNDSPNLKFAYANLMLAMSEDEYSPELKRAISLYKEVAEKGNFKSPLPPFSKGGIRGDLVNYNLALAYYRQGDLEKSRGLLLMLKNSARVGAKQTASPLLSATHRFRAQIYYERGDKEKFQAEKIWLLQNAEQSDVAEVPRLRGLNPQTSDDELLLAHAFVMLNPGEPLYLNNLAIILAQKGQLDKAAKTLRKAAASTKNGNPNIYQAVYENLSKIYQAQGKRVLANEAREIAKKL